MIIYLRHGQTDANAKRILIGGEVDIPLNDNGIRQAKEFAAANRGLIRTLDAVRVSPMQRALKTAEIIIDGHNLPVEIDEDLREWNLGQWSGLSCDDVPDLFTARRDAPGGETWQEFRCRGLRALHRAAAKASEGKILVVAHGGLWYTSYASHFSDVTQLIENCTPYDLCRIRLADLIP